MPGLINMHVHLAGNGKPQKKQRDNEKLVKTIMSNGVSRVIAYKMVADFAREELMSGVTTIRTVGGLGNFDTRLRDEIKQYDFWRELFYFHKYVGVSNTFALYTATKRSAELSGIGNGERKVFGASKSQEKEKGREGTG